MQDLVTRQDKCIYICKSEVSKVVLVNEVAVVQCLYSFSQPEASLHLLLMHLFTLLESEKERGGGSGEPLSLSVKYASG